MASRWTKEEKELLIKLRSEGLSIKEIAPLIDGRSEATIKNMAAKLAPKNASWTIEEDYILKSNSHLCNKEIAQLLPHRTLEAVRTRMSAILVKTGEVPSKKRKAFIWTQELIDKVITLYNNNIKYKEIAFQLDIPFSSLDKKILSLRKEGLISLKVNLRDWTEEEEAKVYELRSQKVSNSKIAEELGRTQPSVAMHISKLIKAGQLETSSTNIRRKEPTKLYLIYFTEENFYKVGITQQTIADRFLGYPQHDVVEVLTFDTLELAKEIEKELLKAVKPFKYTPLVFKSGSTECFQCPKVKSMTDLMAYAEAWK